MDNINRYTQTQTYRLICTQADKQTGRQIQLDRQIQMDREADRSINIQIYTGAMQRQADSHTEIQTENCAKRKTILQL